MDTKQTILISFIIPTLNEAENIKNSIKAIKDNTPKNLSYEIIIVDSGSSDNTVEISKENGAIVHKGYKGNIANSRNIGAHQSKGEILVFIDADVQIQNIWGREIEKTIAELEKQPLKVTGSIVDIYNKENYIEKYWFGPKIHSKNINYMNSGHLIVTKKLFYKIEGFNMELETGEDYDFCQRAKKIGAIISNNMRLRVVHTGYPKDLKTFFKRERWHGRGDYASLRSITSSKPALISISFVLILIMCISLSLLLSTPYYSVLFLIYLLAVSGLSAFIRNNKSFKGFTICLYLYIFYFAARVCSGFDVLILNNITQNSLD